MGQLQLGRLSAIFLGGYCGKIVIHLHICNRKQSYIYIILFGLGPQYPAQINQRKIVQTGWHDMQRVYHQVTGYVHRIITSYQQLFTSIYPSHLFPIVQVFFLLDPQMYWSFVVVVLICTYVQMQLSFMWMFLLYLSNMDKHDLFRFLDTHITQVLICSLECACIHVHVQ